MYYGKAVEETQNLFFSLRDPASEPLHTTIHLDVRMRKLLSFSRVIECQPLREATGTRSIKMKPETWAGAAG